jgi:hypothetical protein
MIAPTPMPAPPASAAPVAGATNGMPAPAANPLAQEFQSVVQRTKVLIQHLKQMPGIDQQKLDQGIQVLGQAVQLIAAAVQRQG